MTYHVFLRRDTADGENMSQQQGHTPLDGFPTTRARPRVVIIGAGFAGVQAAKALRRASADVLLIDRRNHHLFQPLLYQVATCGLSPAEIAYPVRRIFRHQPNVAVALVEADAIDRERRMVIQGEYGLEYDYLVIAAGVRTSYFGHNEWASAAPGLKTIDDATEIRRRILLAFEAAEIEEDDGARRALLTFAIVGAGPTGVELAGAIKEIATSVISQDFRRVNTRLAKVVLFEGGDRVLPAMPEGLSARARRDLEAIGVEVRTNSRVSEVTGEGLRVGTEFIGARNVFWAAGVEAEPISRSLATPLDRAGRVQVGPDLTVPDDPRVFVVADLAAATSANTGKPVPGIAPGAIQMGQYAGRIIAGELAAIAAGRPPPARVPFVYHDKGSLATIGRARAVGVVGSWSFTGFAAWFLWGGVHVAYLVGYRNRLVVLLGWMWEWLVFSKGARLITGTWDMRLKRRPREAVRLERVHPDQAEPLSAVPGR